METSLDKVQKVLTNMTQGMRFVLKILKKYIDLIHKISGLIGTNSILIQVIGTQEKKLKR